MPNVGCPPDWSQLLPKIVNMCSMKNLWRTFQKKMWKQKLILHQFVEKEYLTWQPVIPGNEKRWPRRSILVCYCYRQKIKLRELWGTFSCFYYFRKVTVCIIWGFFLLALQSILYLCALKVKGSLLWHKIRTSHKLLVLGFAYIITILPNYFWIYLHNEKGNSFFSITVNIKMCLSFLHGEGMVLF